MSVSNLKKVILKYRDLIPLKIYERDVEVYKPEFDKANLIVGPRRSGKTFFLYNLMKSEKNPVLINFEDNLLDEVNRADLNKIPDFSKELFGGECFSFFFDELQMMPGWERFIVSLLNEHYSVYITGSNSKLLSKEIASSLRGKSISYLMLPLSFREYLRFNDVMLEKGYEYGDKAIGVKRHFREYFKYGGFPEVVMAEPEAFKNRLMNNYFDSVLYKDLVDRLGLKNIRLVEVTIKYILNLFGNTFSISAFERYLKSNKMPYSLEDLYNLLRSLQDVFMACFVKRYSKSFKKSEFSKSKVYLFDTGYIHFFAGEPEDFGRILENVVFIELFRREGNIENKNIFYFREKNECDFVVTSRDRVQQVIQVTYEFNDRNRKREIDGLLEAIDSFGLESGLILTYDEDDEFEIDGRRIIVMPVWKWLLE